MSNIEGVFSIRVVIADFYLEKPTIGLDPCYSEFRGKEIKRVPIIRVFGSNATGQKTCMHVHGVFPYFYIPYEKKDFDSLNKAIYQIAFNVDKAINISLGQGSSAAQHVFKIQLVKGIPFYGYHRAEHQYLKIYMFNPRFVRRAANLLQNGAILGKNFHPHESHVPYILQFMIDYNLYGMSFLHVPLEIVKFRRNAEDDIPPFVGIQPTQILSSAIVTKKSISALEVDIGSNFILNRFQLLTKGNSTHTNPGIESIWHDENVRRQKLALSLAEDGADVKAIPPLEIPATQERPNVVPTDSEVFYRTALLSKLLTMETSIQGSGSLDDQTINCTLQSNATNTSLNATNSTTREKKRTFNLQKLLANAVYPEECSQDDQLTKAFSIENHLSNNSIFQTTLKSNTSAKDTDPDDTETNDESIFLDDTIVDEKLVLSLTQPHVPLDATLREEDMELLDVLQQLEANNENTNQIDLDSSLAPLSQQHKNFDLSPELLDKETAAAATNQPISDNECDSGADDDDGSNLNDFSVALEDIDQLILKLTQSQPMQANKSSSPHLPQIDGGDDLRTPTKSRSTKQLTNAKQQRTPPLSTPKRKGTSSGKGTAAASPTRSPRTPKSSAASKYAQLPLIITNKSVKKNLTNTIDNEVAPINPSRLSLEVNDNFKSSKVSLRKRVALTEMRRKSISVESELRENETIPTSTKAPIRRSRRTADLDKTHITCALTPRRKSERLLKVYYPEKGGTPPNISTNSEPSKKHEVKAIQANEDVKRTQKSPGGRTPKAHTIVSNQSKGSGLKINGLDNVKSSANLELKVLGNNVEDDIDSESKNTVETVEEIERQIESPSTTKETHLKSFDNDKEEKEEDTDEEIVASDHESSDGSLVKLRKTPNLKRLRRSFRAGNQSKRKKLLADSPGTEPICNSSKFENIEKSFTPPEPKTPSPIPNISIHSDDENSIDDDDDASVKSFYEKSFMVNSPSVFSDVGSPAVFTANGMYKSPVLSTPPLTTSIPHSTDSTTSAKEPCVIVTPLDLPPTYDEVLKSCQKFGIHEYEFQKPYYSNPDDLTKQKEIGYTILQIPGNKLNDCVEFQSVLGADAKGLTDWRRKKLVEIGGPAMLNRYRNSQRIREYFASNKCSVITPQVSAPTRQEAKMWLKARELLQTKDNDIDVAPRRQADEDSPIKIQRKKVMLMLNDGTEDGGGSGDDDNEDMDCSSRSLNLTPLTPCNQSQFKGKLVKEHTATPLTTITNKDSMAKTNEGSSKQRRRSRRAKLSLNAKLKEAAEEEKEVSPTPTPPPPASNNSKPSKDQDQDLAQNSQISDSIISSQAALAELERSSFVKNLQSSSSGQPDLSFGLSSATLNNTFGFKVNLENLQQAKSDIEYNYLTTVTLEVFVPTRHDLYPNPEIDGIRCIFYAIENSIPSQSIDESTKRPAKACGYIIVNDCSDISKEARIHGIDADIEVKVVSTEIDGIQALLELCSHWDPDIYAGYEIERASWGYVMERAKYLCLDIGPLLSRVPSQKVRDFVEEDRDHFTELDFEMKLCGRILLDVWRLMRSEIALTSYSFENVMYHILHKRCPRHSFRELTTWFSTPGSRWIVMEFYLERVRGTLSLLDQLDLIGRTSEMAKLIGIQFYEVLSRGSQFRVESMMLRIAKPKNVVPLSPSVQQRAHMRAPEYLALILEPQSRFYADPVIVLDFQSLYPSMIIAYNYCYSTCLGRVEHLGQSSSPFEFGAHQLRVSPKLLRKLLDRDLVTISPCGVVFIKASVREGILPRMLTEILDTRQMVKQSMKLHKSNTALQRILHSRQLGLKLMANVTYGYTAANFSGRMPAVEVGDTVVSKGRETLERAIKMVETNDKWNVKVVYGDTDSMFVLVPGRNRKEAFRIGEEIVEAVTQANPQPVKLKLEKVYQPCILQTKKRYVGYMYETVDQAEPVYEAKGIETVRRDGCPAAAKMLEKVLRILFETADVSQVKQYVCRQFTKLLSGRANLQDLIFAKEFRGLNGYKPTACVPALELTRKWMQTDPRHVPRCGERVPYIITNGPPGVPLIRLIRSPHEVLADEGLKINAIYYITKAIIPPLNRCLLLIGADVNEWFTNLPRKLLVTPTVANAGEIISTNPLKKSTISQYFSTTNCIIDCGRQTKQGICSQCERHTMKTYTTLQGKISKIERGYQLTQQICQACCGRVGDLSCNSLDCPVLYVLEVKRRDLQQIVHFRHLLDERF